MGKPKLIKVFSDWLEENGPWVNSKFLLIDRGEDCIGFRYELDVCPPVGYCFKRKEVVSMNYELRSDGSKLIVNRHWSSVSGHLYGLAGSLQGLVGSGYTWHSFKIDEKGNVGSL